MIAKAYELCALPQPVHLTFYLQCGHTLAVRATQASLTEICRVVTWTSPLPFIKHYKVDKFALAEAAFGRKILQWVHTRGESSDQTGPARTWGQ